MNPNTQFERDLEQWLRAEAPASAPTGFHASVMDRARTLRQRPGWATSLPVRRSDRDRGMTLLAAAALVLVGGALAVGSGLLRLPTVVPPVPEPSVIAVATASPDATFPGSSESAAPTASPIPVAGPGGIWIPTGTMGTPRSNYAAVRLLDGRVLVVGGDDSRSAELYDPATGTWFVTGSMLKGPEGFPPTLLGDGRVLVGHADEADDAILGAEVYDPATGTWTVTGDPVRGSQFDGGTATVLRDGKVLVAGDSGSQVYDPDSGTWTVTGTMTTPRHLNAATLMSDGRVLAAGGYVFSPPVILLDSAEVYDPDTGEWTAIANLQAPLRPDGAFLQPDGRVLVVGTSQSDPPSFGELYDPVTGAWTAIADMPPAGVGGTATLLSDGTLLLGYRFDPPSAELYNPSTGSWTTTAPMLRSHATPGEAGPPAMLLLDGTVLVAGGSDCLDGQCVATGAAELYVPAGVSPPPLPTFPSPPPPVFPSPTPIPTPLAPAAGPIPPNARSWTVTVENKSSEPATLFVAEEDEHGISRLVGSATPNVVPAGAAVKVLFLFPAKGDPDDGWIFVNPRPGEGGALVYADQIGIPGKIVITADGQVGWASP